MTNNKELTAAVFRLCSAYAKDETSPTVISNKHDIRLICSYLSEVILPPNQTQAQIEETKADHRRARTISPLPSPCRGTHEPIIEKGGGTGPTTTKRHNTHTHTHTAKATIATTTASSALSPSTPAGDEKSDNATLETSNSTSSIKTAPSSTIPPEKPKRRRKIRLSASTFEELGVTEMDSSAAGGGIVNGGGDFDADGFDFWGAVESTPVSKGKGKKKKALIRPDDDSETEGVGGVEGW